MKLLDTINSSKAQLLTYSLLTFFYLLRQQATWQVSHPLWPDRGGRFFHLLLL